MAFDLHDYVPVAERIAKLRAAHPDAVIQTIGYEFRDLNGQTVLIVCAACWLTPDDPRPGIAFASEPFPGKTPYTRDSEIMNAETSAWGRAIVAKLAADTTRSIASRDEVEARKTDRDAPTEERPATVNQLRALERLIEERGLPDGVPWPLPHDPTPTMRQASGWLDAVKALPEPPPNIRVATLRDDTVPDGSDVPLSAAPGPSGLPPEPSLEPAERRPWERRPFPQDATPDGVERYWKVATAAIPGVGPTTFLKAARDIAADNQLEVPAALDAINDPELVAAVRLWLTVRADEKGI